MIQINQCKLPVTHDMEELERKICTILRIKDSKSFTWHIRRRSIDARKKPDIYYVYTIWVSIPDEESVVSRLHNPQVQIVARTEYAGIKYAYESTRTIVNHHDSPVIIGAGPAGLFAAYLLTEAGLSPVVLERGKPIRERRADVEHFWRTGLLNPESNVLFGEGGAGTFSDGKLNTSDKDKTGRISFVLETFARFGAPYEIMYDQKPHIGTDVLENVITAMREYLEKKGCRFIFGAKFEDIGIANGKLQQILYTLNGHQQIINTDKAVLAIGHSSRDTFLMLNRRGIPMETKNFAVGLRVEHPQAMIDEAMYGRANIGKLPPAPYKLTSNFPNGRGVYSFCMCPGGYVVNSSSERGGLAVNGMSYSARDGVNANSAIVVSVSEKDFIAQSPDMGYRNDSAASVMSRSNDPLAGMRYQIALEKEAYRRGGGAIPQQLFGDFVNGTPSECYGDFESQTMGARTLTSLRGLFSEDIENSFIQGMRHFGKIISGFDRPDAILSGVESRTSSPVRILRGESLESTAAEGLYPCGEGAGYAGGIVSAAVDGLKVAEAIIGTASRTR